MNSAGDNLIALRNTAVYRIKQVYSNITIYRVKQRRKEMIQEDQNDPSPSPREKK